MVRYLQTHSHTKKNGHKTLSVMDVIEHETDHNFDAAVGLEETKDRSSREKGQCCPPTPNAVDMNADTNHQN